MSERWHLDFKICMVCGRVWVGEPYNNTHLPVCRCGDKAEAEWASDVMRRQDALNDCCGGTQPADQCCALMPQITPVDASKPIAEGGLCPMLPDHVLCPVCASYDFCGAQDILIDEQVDLVLIGSDLMLVERDGTVLGPALEPNLPANAVDESDCACNRAPIYMTVLGGYCPCLDDDHCCCMTGRCDR